MPLRPEWSTRPAGPPLLHRRLCFILGKGGTGRSTVAAALAVLAARTGRQTLLVELIEGGRLSELFRTADIRTDRPVPLGSAPGTQLPRQRLRGGAHRVHQPALPTRRQE